MCRHGQVFHSNNQTISNEGPIVSGCAETRSSKFGRLDAVPQGRAAIIGFVEVAAASVPLGAFCGPHRIRHWSPRGGHRACGRWRLRGKGYLDRSIERSCGWSVLHQHSTSCFLCHELLVHFACWTPLFFIQLNSFTVACLSRMYLELTNEFPNAARFLVVPSTLLTHFCRSCLFCILLDCSILRRVQCKYNPQCCPSSRKQYRRDLARWPCVFSGSRSWGTQLVHEDLYAVLSLVNSSVASA